MLSVNRTRFLNTLNTVAEFGLLADSEGGGRDRRPFSPTERNARRYFTEQAETAGLTVTTDAAANLSAKIGVWTDRAKTLLLGSHLDTVPNGGPYDGALGVIAALEVLRVVAEEGLSLPFDLEAIAFTDEEGRFGDFFGSRSLVGSHTDGTLKRSSHGPKPTRMIWQAMSELGLRWRDPARLSPGSTRSRKPWAAISNCTSSRARDWSMRAWPSAWSAPSSGALHSGLRSLAVPTTRVPRPWICVPTRWWQPVSLSRVRLHLCVKAFPDAVITCGGISVEPGVYNVVPGRVTLLVEFRAATQIELAGIDDALQGLAAEITSAPGLSHGIRADKPPRAGAHGSSHAGGDSPGIRPARPRLHGSALRRGSRRPGDGRHHAGGHDFRAFQGRAQSLP